MADDDNKSVTSNSSRRSRRRDSRLPELTHGPKVPRSREASNDSKASNESRSSRRRKAVPFDGQDDKKPKRRPSDEHEIQPETGSVAASGEDNTKAQSDEAEQDGEESDKDKQKDSQRRGQSRGKHLEDVGEPNILQVLIHATDELKPHMHLRHPVIKLSIVKVADGTLMEKSKAADGTLKNAVQQHENSTVFSVPTASPKKQKGAKSDDEEKDDPKSPMEGKTKPYDKILPVLTQPFDLSVNLRDGKSLACGWEETIGFDEHVGNFDKHEFIFLFELLDFVHTTDEMDDDHSTRKKKKASGKIRKDFWIHVAWSFLRPNDKSAGGHVNFGNGNKLRLQLYKYRKFWFWEKVPKDADCQAYWQWKSCEKRGNWTPYKSTLYVSILGVPRPLLTTVAMRSHMPWEKEEGQNDLEFSGKKDIKKGESQALSGSELNNTRLGTKWVGATGKWCRVPNVPMHKLESDHRGCFVMAFSTYGTFLACAVGGRQMYKIKIFNVANGTLAATLPGHHEIVYDMEWGNNPLEESGNEGKMSTDLKYTKPDGGGDLSAESDASLRPKDAASLGKLILTASADTTAKVWSVESRELVAACHHPSYVYTARFCPGPDGVSGDTEVERVLSACAYVITGCYDHNIRLWDVRLEMLGADKSAQIVKVVQGHKSHINSIVIDPAKTKVYSGDGAGQICVWQMLRHSFDLVQEVKDPGVRGNAINCLRIDRTGKKLAVLARDNCIRLFDSDRWTIIQRFSGLRCTNQHIRCDLSPDGKYIMSGSEDGLVHVWNVDSGELDLSVGTSRLPQMKGLCSDVAWNPAERIIAACAFSRKHPVLVHKYEREKDHLAGEEMADDEIRDVLAGKFDGLAEAFIKIDKDGSGTISKDEFHEGMSALELDLNEMQILKIFKAAAGSNNEISVEEFIKRFAPVAVLENMRTQRSIDKARQRHAAGRGGLATKTPKSAALLSMFDDSPKRTPSKTARAPNVSGNTKLHFED